MAFEEIETDVEQIVAQKQAQYRAAVLDDISHVSARTPADDDGEEG